MAKHFRFFVATLLLTLAFPLASPGASTTPPSVTAEELETQVRSKIESVPEFKFIVDFARKAGLRVWLFGGTASSFAHYAKQDLLRQKGDERYQPDRFDYDYTNIYRSNQDLDIVIDGSGDKAHELQRALAAKFPHLQGQKSAWEVRLLREGLGEKEAILGNPDFSNQHTDSHSVGMIELTDSREPVIRDLRDWTNPRPSFLSDVLSSRLHYYFSSSHMSTNRAKKGLNPPIISVIRYYIKAFQFELAMNPADEPTLKEIISRFDPKKLTDYEKSWLEKNVPKLFQNAVNIEYAWNVLDANGLRQKLLQITSLNSVNSASWWMNKEPLRSKEFGKSGRTARELGITTVAHETRSFEAYESITRAHTGDPNVLISRQTAHGEAAAYGDGFYTRVGRQGAAGTNITIRFQVHPDAREGIDFIRPKDSPDYVIFRNKRALRVIPESLNWGFRDYVNFLRAGSVDSTERALLEKLKRRLNTRIATETTAADIEWFDELIRREIAENEYKFNKPLVKAWFDLRRPLETKIDRRLLMDVFDFMKKTRTFGTIIQESAMPKLPFMLRYDEYLRFIEELQPFMKDTVPSRFEVAPFTKDELRKALEHVRRGSYSGDLAIRDWLPRALESDLPMKDIVASLPKTGGELNRLITSSVEPKHRRRITYAEYLKVIETFGNGSAFVSDKLHAVQKYFIVAEPSTADLELLKQTLRKERRAHETPYAFAHELIERFGPLSVEARTLLKKDAYDTTLQFWLHDRDGKRIDVTLEQTFDLLDREHYLSENMDVRLNVTRGPRDAEVLRAKLLASARLSGAAIDYLVKRLPEIDLSPAEMRDLIIPAISTLPLIRRETAFKPRLTLFKELTRRYIGAKKYGASDVLLFVEEYAKNRDSRFYDLETMETSLAFTAQDKRDLETSLNQVHAIDEVEEAKIRLWMRAHSDVLQSRRSTLLELFERSKIGHLHARTFVTLHRGLPPWAENDPAFWKVLGANDSYLIEPILKNDRYLKDSALLRKLIEAVHPRLQKNVISAAFTYDKSSDMELLIRSLERLESGPNDWEVDQALARWREHPRIRQLMKNNSFLKRKVTLNNVKSAIQTERYKDRHQQPPLTKRVFGTWTCPMVFR